MKLLNWNLQVHAHLANNGISTTNVADIQVQHKTPLHSVEKISLTPYKWKASSIDANSVKTVAFFWFHSVLVCYTKSTPLIIEGLSEVWVGGREHDQENKSFDGTRELLSFCNLWKHGMTKEALIYIYILAWKNISFVQFY